MEETPGKGNGRRRKVVAGIIFSVIGIIAIISVYLYLQYKSTHISTDDAYVEGDIYTIASRVNGTVKKIYVDDNQYVKKGEILLQLDPVDYDVKVKESEAALYVAKAKMGEARKKIEAAEKRLEQLQFRLRAARANLELQEANLRQAEIDIKRAENLYRKEAMSKEKYQQTQTDYKVRFAQVRAAKDQMNQAAAALETQKAVIRQTESALRSEAAVVKQKEAALEAAQLDAGYTKIYAPADGHVTKKSAEVGNRVQSGQPLMAVVPLEGVYVTANYKETQLAKVKAGQKVDISVDAYPGKEFRGTVNSIMAGTGSAFSLFPPENATGNYVKVVQRVPVKIVLDKNTDPGHVLRVGMSVVPTILVK
ncbi:MAG: HlyD family secretion protein [Candidatus Sulfobium sp.]|jgi:membrane fusion protein (multidrug efflux system)